MGIETTGGISVGRFLPKVSASSWTSIGILFCSEQRAEVLTKKFLENFPGETLKNAAGRVFGQK